VATKAVSESPAHKILYETQIAANFVETEPRATKLTVIPEGLVLESGDKVVLITAYDYIDNSTLGNQLADKVLGFRKRLGKKSAELWNGGAVNGLFTTAVTLKGIKVHRMCLFEKASSQPDV